MSVWRAAAVAAISILLAPSATAVSHAGGPPKPTGGIIALYPRTEDAERLAIPWGEPPEYLHETLAYLSDDVSGSTECELRHQLADLAAAQPNPIEANVFGHAIFSQNDDEGDSAVVYLAGDSPDLAPLRQRVLESSQRLFSLPAQHDPWTPHITATYGPSDNVLSYTGPVVFDRIGLTLGGNTTYFVLGNQA